MAGSIQKRLKRKIKVAYLFPNFFWIGAQRGAAAVLRSLDREKFEPMVFVIRKTEDMAGEIPSDAPVIELGAGSALAGWRGLRLLFWPFFLDAAIRRQRPDIVVGISPQCNFVLVAHRRLFGKKCVFIAEEHQHLTTALKTEPQGFPAPWRWIYRWSLRGYNNLEALRTVSNAARDDFIANWGLLPQQVRAIHPAFDLERIRKNARGAAKEAGVPAVCSIGRLTDQKNFELLIRAFRLVRDEMPCRLLIGGKGPNEAALRSTVNELGLDQDVQLLGFVQNAEALVASSTLFAMSSVWEGFPATLVEAMALGVPVVSVNCLSGPAELIKDGVNGRLVLGNTPRDLADGILSVLRHPEQISAMGRNASERAEAFSPARQVGAQQKMFLQLAMAVKEAAN